MWKSGLEMLLTNRHSDETQWWHVLCPTGESTLTDAMTAAGKTYEEIAQLVAEQVGSVVAAVLTHTHWLYCTCSCNSYITASAFCGYSLEITFVFLFCYSHPNQPPLYYSCFKIQHTLILGCMHQSWVHVWCAFKPPDTSHWCRTAGVEVPEVYFRPFFINHIVVCDGLTMPVNISCFARRCLHPSCCVWTTSLTQCPARARHHL